jgi:serine hydrolase
MGSFLILHGWTGSGVEHWQSRLALALRRAGGRVLYPELPDADEPQRDRWLAALDEQLAEAGSDATVLCHSLACLLWFHHAARSPDPVARALLVAPPTVVYPEFASFFPVPFDPAKVTAAAAETLLVCADGDPYCPERADRAFPGLPTRLVPNGGHVNTDAGFGPWPWAERWVLAG